MTPQEARAIVAKKIAADRLADDAGWYGWGDYPEIGMDDWDAIVGLAVKAVTPPAPAFYDAAYALLAARAEDG